jgi:hypothetical protein
MADMSLRSRRGPNRTGFRTERRMVALRFTPPVGVRTAARPSCNWPAPRSAGVLSRYRILRLTCLAPKPAID